MALNYPGPVEVRLFYSKLGLQHEARYNCNSPTTLFAGMDAADIDLYDKIGVAGDAVTVVTAWVTLLKVLYSAADVTFDYFEVWEYDGDTHLATFIAAETLTVAGTHANTGSVAGQLIFTFRTQEGNSMRLSLMEAAVGTTSVLGYAGLPANEQAIVDFVLSDSNWILARDTSYPAAFIRALYGSNEALFKRRFR